MPEYVLFRIVRIFSHILPYMRAVGVNLKIKNMSLTFKSEGNHGNLLLLCNDMLLS